MQAHRPASAVLGIWGGEGCRERYIPAHRHAQGGKRSCCIALGTTTFTCGSKREWRVRKKKKGKEKFEKESLVVLSGRRETMGPNSRNRRYHGDTVLKMGLGPSDAASQRWSSEAEQLSLRLPLTSEILKNNRHHRSRLLRRFTYTFF